MKPPDFIDTARILLASNRSKPTSISCRRAISACYYALFHCLARECANLLIGGPNSIRSTPAWRQVYRALDHTHAKNQCQAVTNRGFPQEIVDFATVFATMQIKRHEADYDPFATFVKSQVQADIIAVEGAIATFAQASTKDRRAFCAWVIFKKPRS